ncbi:MAG: cytochrome C [Deltaproteobacteria bacterium]|nr:cytochrome C [Deltaproteobacteria bacterium]
MKKKILKGVLGGLGLLAAGIAAFVSYSVAVFPPTFPDVPAPDLKASTDPQIVERGRYLFEAVAHCNACHTLEEDYAFKDVGGLVPSGGHEWVMGPMGTLRSANITSDVETGIGGWSDGDLARVLKYAVRPNHEPALMMVGVGPMADEDIVALMSYVRSLPPVRNSVPPSDISLMGKVVFPNVAQAYVSPKPDWDVPPKVEEGAISVERGAYLANGPAFCFVCHSNPQMSPELGVIGPRFAGCVTPDPAKDPTMEICAPNLTPDPKTGVMEGWSEDEFVTRFGSGRVVESSPMPWESFKLMTDADKRSIFQYLLTVDPVERVTGPAYRPKGWTPE